MIIENRVGFVRNPIADVKAWKLGSVELPKTVLVENGDWEPYVPEFESQTSGGYETYACTVEGTENILQILEKRLFGKTGDYDVRYNYNIAKIVPPGADPHDVAETFRNNGTVAGVYPIPKTYTEFALPRPIPGDILSLGLKHPYELRHQYLWNHPLGKEARTEMIREHLKYSPLGISVTAWRKKGDVYVDNGQPNTHWTVIVGEQKGKGWKVFDTYEPKIKILSYDHNIEVCKRYQLVSSTRVERLNLLQKTIQLLNKLLESLFPPKAYDVDPRELPMNQDSNQEKLYKAALSYLGKEASPRDVAPDDLACAESVCTVIREVLPDFPVILSTAKLYETLGKDSRFKATLDLEPGNIIVSPTGYGNGNLSNGHTGIFLEDKHIASNSSKTGLWEDNFTVDSWVRYYRTKGGFPLKVFTIK